MGRRRRLRLLTVLPDGTPVQGSLPEPRAGTNAISAEGSHILFVSGGSLYVRIDGERTVQVDESQGGGGSSGGGSFQAASADGTEIFFTDDRELTPTRPDRNRTCTSACCPKARASAT